MPDGLTSWAENFIRQRSNKPRVKVPLKIDRDKYQVFADAVDQAVKSSNLAALNVTDDKTFLDLYTRLSSIITTNASKVFGKSKLYTKNSRDISNSVIRSIALDIRYVGGAIRFEKSNRTTNISRKALKFHQNALACSLTSQDILTSLISCRKALHKRLFAKRSKEISSRAKLSDQRKMSAALRGNSTKKLVHGYNYIPLPLAVNDIDNPEKLICSPEGVKSMTKEYFRRLYDHSRIPTMPKPWLDTPSVTNVRSRVADDPFEWPRLASLGDLRALLRKGNNRPSPGPDQWEKWTIKSLSDDALSLVLKLVNYQVMNSCFPGNVKDMWLTMFHKRNLRTDLQNWRGLLISNLLANLPMAWLNSCLICYSADKRILPDTQVAAQPGVQTRDLISFLSGIKCWASCHKQTVFAIKRDQMKGFDYLSPDGFYDAVRAYGLPEAVIDLDRASQTNTQCFIRTAYGITDPITISGVNKQGGPASPLKSVFTTSLGSYYLQDLLLSDKDALVISSSSMMRGDPHIKGADIELQIGMVEATDDFFIFSKSLSSLIKNMLEMEQFQFAYGWMTQWSKSCAYILGESDDLPNQAVFQSVSTLPNTDPMIVSEHRVDLIDNQLDFLRTKVNDPSSRFEELKAFIESFQFPTIIGRLPITLLRKIISQNVISRCRALLSLQPIKQNDAETLDKIITWKVHDALGFPFQPSSIIATLPVSHHGLGFPSIARINASLAVEGLMRDLNHHLTAYRSMAKITLLDWMCDKNNCSYPLAGDGLRTDFSRMGNSIPHAWLTAHQILKNLDLSLLETDQSYIAEGDVSFSHIVRSCSHNRLQRLENVNGTTLRSLRLKGVRKLADVGRWMIDGYGNISSHLVQPLFDRSWTYAARQNWIKLYDALHGHALIDHLVHGSLDLAIPRQLLRERAEHLISALADICGFSRSQFADTRTWASDGSMLPPSAGILDPKTVVGAATGTRTLAVKIPGSNISILQGELIGLILALILSKDTDATNQYVHRLLTDHLNTVRLVEDSRTGVDQTSRLRFMNGRSYYRWLLTLSNAPECPTQILYTPGHSTETTIEAKLNNEADFYASTSQKFFKDLPQALIPTFLMNDFTFWRRSEGWIESNISVYVDARMAQCCATQMGIGHSLRMSTWAHEKNLPPEFPYTRALSAYSAALQLYARSGQLPTADLLFARGKLPGKKCCLGCDEDESMRHIFVKCPIYQQWRHEAREQLIDKTTSKLESMKIDGSVKINLIHAAKHLFTDNPVIWPLHLTMYYLGQIPSLDTFIPVDNKLNKITLARLKSHISADWHTSSIRLAGRIFGDYQKRMAIINIPSRNTSTSILRTYTSNRRQ